MTISTVVKVIILLITVAILFPFIKGIVEWIYNSNPDQACSLSVIKHAASKEATLTGAKGSDMNCPRKQIVFYNDKVEIDDDKIRVQSAVGEKRSSSFKSLNSYIVNQVMADELVSCYKKMGKGNLNVFNQKIFWMDLDIFNVDRVPCMICSEVNFKGFDIPMDFEGLEYYLKTEDMNSDTKYYDFLAQKSYLLERLNPIKFTKVYRSFGENTEYELSTDKSYTVIFAAGKTTKAKEWTDSDENYYSTHILKTEEIAKTCSFIYN